MTSFCRILRPHAERLLLIVDVPLFSSLPQRNKSANTRRGRGSNAAGGRGEGGGGAGTIELKYKYSI